MPLTPDRAPLSRRITDTPASAPVRLADLASAFRAEGRRVLDFSAGRASEATPAYICEAAERAMEEGHTHQTMAQGTPEYRRACARKLARENGIEADPDRHLIATTGCKQGLLLTLMAILDPGDEVIVEDPCFVSYQPEIRFAGGVPVAVPLRAENGFRWKREELAAAVTPRTRAILFCNPHNPTGTVLTPADLEVISTVAGENGLYVIADEVYERVAWTGHRHISIATQPGMDARTITLTSTTKGYAMGGWRIGFAHAPELLIRAMVIVAQHLQTSASSIAQAAASVAFGEEPGPELIGMRADWEKRCRHVTGELARIPGVRCAMPEGGFYAWIDLRERGVDSVAFAERLLRQEGVVLVPGSAFGSQGEGWLRMTAVKPWDELNLGLECLRRGLA